MKTEEQKKKEDTVEVQYSYITYESVEIPENIVEEGEEAMKDWISLNEAVDVEEIISY